LQGLAGEVPENGVILEIGAAWGYSISKMAEASKDSVLLFTIDPWTLARDGRNWDKSNKIIQTEQEKKFHITIEPYKDRITAYKSFSWNVDFSLPIDLLFIDGDHSFNVCLQDYLMFSRLIKPGGLLVMHDYREKWEGVTRVIDEVVIPSGLWDYRTEMRFFIGVKN